MKKENTHQLRRIGDLSGNHIIWPLVTELNDLVFTRAILADLCVGGDTLVAKKMSRGLVSLVQKGILFKDEQGIYSIHYKLVSVICIVSMLAFLIFSTSGPLVSKASMSPAFLQFEDQYQDHASNGVEKCL